VLTVSSPSLRCVVLISMSSYCIYAASQTASVAAFPPENRGSVSGLCSAVYALSSVRLHAAILQRSAARTAADVQRFSQGVIGALEAAFFPTVASRASAGGDVRPVMHLLVFVAVLALVPLFCALAAFPSTLPPALASARDQCRHGYSAVAISDDQLASSASVETVDAAVASDRNRRVISSGYLAVVCIACDLQLCALADWHGGVYIGRARAELVLACILAALLVLFSMPACEALWQRSPRTYRGVSQSAADESNRSGVARAADESGGHAVVLPLQTLLTSAQFWFMFMMLMVLAGCGGLTLLNTANGLVASRMIPAAPADGHVTPSATTSTSISRNVRAIVVLFSALGVAGRLVGGAVMDLPSWEGLACSGMAMATWRYTLLQLVAGLLAVGMLLCAFARSWVLLLSSGVVGFCHGLLFSAAPALSMDFFGVSTFARDFAVAGIGAGLGASVVALAASLVAGRRREAGSWVDVQASSSDASLTRYCVGVACFAPTYLLCASLLIAFLLCSANARRHLVPH
jgi:hypothetical protein